MPPLLRSEPLVESLVNRFMKKRKRAAYEISKESFQGDDTEIVKLYDEEGTVLGQVELLLNEVVDAIETIKGKNHGR